MSETEIFEKVYYTRKGYYASNYARTYEEILNMHTECKDTPVVAEFIISGLKCPDNAVDHYCENLIASYQHMVVHPWLYFKPEKVEMWWCTDDGKWVKEDGDIAELAGKWFK